jgi:GT2 family glycosyltransferase
MVIHEPGDWLTESLRALAAQDYASLQVLALLTGTSENAGSRDILDIVETELPQAVVRYLGSNPGYAAACNTVLQLVQGDSGFFCFLHDDVALAPDAITCLVDELYRSNAGAVGPKIVHWDNPKMIQSVGIAVDRFGVELPYADDGELDQEQHDAVQDVFVLPGSCLLVRADLFRTVGGFDASIHSSGNDLDLCWRLHTTGARVVVVPSAVARHRESMLDRTAEEWFVYSDTDVESTRVRTSVSLSSRAQLPVILIETVLLTIARGVLLLSTGRASRAWAELRAVLTLPFGVGEIKRRRDAVHEYRLVDGDEVRALQLRGTSHLASYFRRRARRAGLAQSQLPSDVKEAPPRGSYVLWTALVLMLMIGSRSLLLNGSVSVGQMVPFSSSVRDVVSSYASGWWGAGFGQVSALPTGIALTAVAGVAALGNMGLANTLMIVLLPFIGWLGAWRFASVMGTRGARIASAAAYAAVPLGYASIAAGRWGTLLVYAVAPWMLHLLRMLVGHADINDSRPKETMVLVDPFVWRRWFATLVLLVAVAFAFEPGIVIVLPLIAGIIAVTTLAQGLHIRWAGRWMGISSLALLSGIALNLPWAGTYVRNGWWEALSGAPVDSGRDIGLWGLVRFAVGGFTLSLLSVGLYAAVIGALFLVRGARATWTLRGASLVVIGMLLAVLDDSALLPVHVAEPGLMLVPVALGIAISAGAMGASLALDLNRGRLSWRQPLGALVGLAFAVGLFPAAVNSINGSWNQPSLALPQLLAQLPDAQTAGNYRTLFIGDSRVLPGAPVNFGWGISYSVVNGATPAVDEYWETPPTRTRDNAVAAMYGIVRGQTSRAGRLLAPLSVRYIVVPIIDGGQSTRSDPIAEPAGLVEALSRQLDLRRQFASPDLVVFENTAWVPVKSVLTAAGSESSKLAGATSMIATNISGAVSLPASERSDATVAADVASGTLHLAVPFTSRWNVAVDGVDVPARPAFGLTTAYDIAAPGRAVVSFKTTSVQTVLVLIQFVAWCLVIFIALSRRKYSFRRTQPVVAVVSGDPAIVLPDGVPS